MNKKGDNSQKNQRIQVFARCRPLNSIERKQYSPSIVEVIPDKKIVVKDRNANREFLFDKVFPPDTKQISVYKAVVEPLIQEVLMGYNCTVFAYGQTGTGKTYTMEGERNNSKCSWEDDPGAGIIPRSLHQLFEDLNKEENVEFSVRVSFLELYNEELFDLLSTNELSRLRLFEDSSRKGSVIIQGLEEIIVNSKDEVYAILERGTARRQTAATILNATSSRSHTVFSVTIHIKENTIEGEELLKTGKLNLVDLAGSENVGRSGAVDKRAREAGNINQSLLTLGRVITALIEKQPHVPYRESKLTRLLQDSLGGHTKTSIIATISPAHCNFDETISTLDYATKAKSITIKPEANQKMTKKALIREYTEEIEGLRKDLVALRCKEGFYIDMDNYTSLMNDISVKDKLLKDLSEKFDLEREEKAKTEEMLDAMKEELHLTCEKLTEISEKYAETAFKLSNATNALSLTQKILAETTLDRDEKQFLINVQCDFQKELSQQAKKLLHVADETTNDVDKLHAKIERKVAIEKTNDERCREFRMIYEKHFSELSNLLSHTEIHQTANLLKTKENIDDIFQTLRDYYMASTNALNMFIREFTCNITSVSQNVASAADSGVKYTNSLIDELNFKKDGRSKRQFSYLSEKLPEFINEMNAKTSEIQAWIFHVHDQLSIKIESEKEFLNKSCEKRKEYENSLKKSLDLLCKNYENILNDFELQSSHISSSDNQLEKDFEEKLNELKSSITFFEQYSERRKELRKNIFERDCSLMTGIKQNALKFEEVHQPLKEMFNSECNVEKDKDNLNQMLSLMNVDEFLKIQESLKENQIKVVTDFENFTKENIKEEESILLEAESSLNDHTLSNYQNAQSLIQSTSELNSCLEDYAQSEKASFEQNIEEFQKIIHEVKFSIDESQEFLQTNVNQLKDEVQERENEFKKFISNELLKDVPTGTTPQRKSYIYPKPLVTVSPPDRILKKFRSKLAANTAVAVNLPLNDSFNELEESTISLNKSSHEIDTNTVSFSSDEASCDTDSFASTMSDASVHNVKNKENRKVLKKRSRLPKRLAVDNFLKPTLPARKPLVVTNSGELE